VALWLVGGVVQLGPGGVDGYVECCGCVRYLVGGGDVVFVFGMFV